MRIGEAFDFSKVRVMHSRETTLEALQSYADVAVFTWLSEIDEEDRNAALTQLGARAIMNCKTAALDRELFLRRPQ